MTPPPPEPPPPETSSPPPPPGAAPPPSPQRIFVILLAISSLSITALITLNVIRQRRETNNRTSQPAPTQPGLHGGVIAPQNGADPPVLGTLPDFSLTERSDKTVALADLRGKMWIADFIFTRCGGTCPMMSSKMKELRAVMDKRAELRQIMFVSFSVDPAYDTPQVLRPYAESYGADNRWLFLTGERKELWRLALEGFKLSVAEDDKDTVMPITHSSKFVLVDRMGRTRGYYDGLEDEALSKLLIDAEKVCAEPAADPAPVP